MASSIRDLHATMENTMRIFLFNYQFAVCTKSKTLISNAITHDITRQLRPDCPSPVLNTQGTDTPETNTEETQRQFRIGMESFRRVLSTAKVKVHEIVIDPIERRGSALSEHVMNVEGYQPTSLEFCWYVDFTEDGKKISRVVEFHDVSTTSRMIKACSEIMPEDVLTGD
ncbi:hypothetical protein F5Y06DRAFT_295526 [Hypoxylon sp. FL0890]|nr:hypothetical protein F5Y06DRAFT_295526 [Hypoxylon sp. FL0890]